MSVIPSGAVVPISIVAVISTFGIFSNINVAFAAFSLRKTSTCHWFIFGRAIFDIFHQLGHFVTAYSIYSGIGTMMYSTCFMLEFLPFCAVIGTSIMTLAIGVDRFLGFHMPFVYRRLNFTTYIGTVYVLTISYGSAFMILFFLTTTNWNERVLCIPGSVITLDYVYLYLYTTACFYVLTIIQYVSIWIMAFKKRKSSHGYMKIMKPITIIVSISLTGWLSNYVFEVVAGHMEWDTTLSTLWGGITVNLAVAFDFWVYYLFSSEYRKAFRKQLCRRETTEISTTTVKTF